MRVPDLTDDEWEAVWSLLYNAVGNNMQTNMRLRVPDSYVMSEDGTFCYRPDDQCLDPLTEEQLVQLSAIEQKISLSRHPEWTS
jgi:hypothetical protein